MSQLRKRKESEYVPQPHRAPPDPNVIKTKKDLIKYISQITAEHIKKWGDFIIIDTKYRGIRGLVIANPKTGRVNIYSRALKPLDKFAKFQQEAILKDLSPFIREDVIHDAELYALDKKGNVLPQHVVTGYIKNPNDPKYKDVRPLIEVFDIILVNKKDVRSLPLKQRKLLVENSLDYQGRVMYSAEWNEVKNTEKEVEKGLRKVIKEGGEGIVVKDPESEYFYGKSSKGPWVKAKNIDTIDLRLQSAEMYPVKTAKDWKGLKYYRHFNLVPEDNPNHIIAADKGVPSAGFDTTYYKNFTLHLLDLLKQGKVKGEGKVPVDPTYQKIYKRKTLPAKIIIPKRQQPIFEVITEEMSQDLKPAGQKLVGERPDKKKADKMSDLRTVFKSFYKKRAPVEDFK